MSVGPVESILTRRATWIEAAHANSLQFFTSEIPMALNVGSIASRIVVVAEPHAAVTKVAEGKG